MRYIVVGCGRVGSGLARTLEQSGHDLVVVDKDPASFERLGNAFKGSTVEGISFDRQVLRTAGIENVDGLAAATSSDEANVVTAFVARNVFHVPSVVARLYDQRQAEIYHRLGLQTVSPNTWGISRMADILYHSHLEPVYSLPGGDVSLVTAEITPLLVGRPVRHLAMNGDVSVVTISRHGKSFLPAPQTCFESEDVLLLAVTSQAAERIDKLLKSQ